MQTVIIELPKNLRTATYSREFIFNILLTGKSKKVQWTGNTFAVKRKSLITYFYLPGQTQTSL